MDKEFYKKQEASLLRRIDILKKEVDKLLADKIELKKQLNLNGVVDTLVCCENCLWFDKGNCNNENACIDFSKFKAN